MAVANPDVTETTCDEEVKAVIVPEPGHEIEPAELVEVLAERMPYYCASLRRAR